VSPIFISLHKLRPVFFRALFIWELTPGNYSFTFGIHAIGNVLPKETDKFPRLCRGNLVYTGGKPPVYLHLH